MSRSLVIGFGNIDRADDGAAHAVVNLLRRRLGEEELGEGETGLDDLDDSGKVDSVFLIQPVPELADNLARYDRVVFVDAHVDPNMSALYCAPIQPESAPPLFSHHLTPAMLLALAGVLHGKAPRGHLVSVRGIDFDFHRGLSPECAILVAPAVEKILDLTGSPDV